MSAADMQRMALLMHWHPRWHARLKSDDVPARVQLTNAERSMLLAVDPRAFRADDMRVPRMVTALAGELPVSVASVGLPTLFALFERDDVVDALMPQGRLVSVASTWLRSNGAWAADIELMMAQAARRQPSTHEVQTAHGVGGIVVDDNVWAHYQTARTALGNEPQVAIAAGFALPSLPSRPEGQQVGLCVVGAGTPSAHIGGCTLALATVLHHFSAGCSWSTAVQTLLAHGADDTAEAALLLRDWQDGGLVHCAVPVTASS
jgi:hypothetical protein